MWSYKVNNCNMHIKYRWRYFINIFTCSGTWPLYVTCLRYWSLLNTKFDVLGYCRRRSVCYSGLFTTSLVVTTISFYNVLWPSDVASPERSWFLCSGPLISFDLVFSDLCWSLFGSAAFILTVGRTRRHLLEEFRFPCQLALLRISTIRLSRNS
jgi:hypothetical protein